MTDPYLTAINKQINNLPALPATVTKVLAVTADPESSANDLMRVILPDQTMCATILKIANSAFFGIPRGVSTIERAVVVLGQAEVRNIVIGKALFSSFPKLNNENKETVNLFWEHAFTCGLTAKIIAADLQLSPSEFFVAGLIHDIGKLAMLMAFPNQYPVLRDLANPVSSDNSTEERSQFSITHDKVGMQLANKWMLPIQLTTAIGFHHSPQDTLSYQEYPLIVQVADILSLMYCHPDSLKKSDVENIFSDFLTDTSELWRKKGFNWQPENFGQWYDILHEQREKGQDILSAFAD